MTAKNILKKNKRRNLVLKGFAKEVEVFVFNHHKHLALEVVKKSTGQVLVNSKYGKVEALISSNVQFKVANIAQSLLSAVEKGYQFDNLQSFGDIEWKIQEHNLTPEMLMQFEINRFMRELGEAV